MGNGFGTGNMRQPKVAIARIGNQNLVAEVQAGVHRQKYALLHTRDDNFVSGVIAAIQLVVMSGHARPDSAYARHQSVMHLSLSGMGDDLADF